MKKRLNLGVVIARLAPAMLPLKPLCGAPKFLEPQGHACLTRPYMVAVAAKITIVPSGYFAARNGVKSVTVSRKKGASTPLLY